MTKSNYINLFKSLQGERLSTITIIERLIDNITFRTVGDLVPLKDSLHEFILSQKNIKIKSYTKGQIEKQKQILREKGNSIPILGLEALTEKDCTDIEALMFPNEFDSLKKLYSLIDLLIDKTNTTAYKKFEDYFINKVSNENMENLKSTFIEKNSGDEIAMMLASLFELGLIQIAKKGTKNLFRAVYDFLSLFHTKETRFTNISNYLQKDVNGQITYLPSTKKTDYSKYYEKKKLIKSIFLK